MLWYNLDNLIILQAKQRRKNKKVFRKKSFFFLIIIFVLSLIGVGFLSVNLAKAEDSEEEEDINEYITWKEGDDLSFDKTIYVDPWVTITIEKGAEIKLEDGARIYVGGGRIIANGTKNEPIKITSTSSNSNSLVEFHPNGWGGIPDSEPSFFRYVEFSNGGHEEVDPCPDGCSAFLQYLFPKALAFEGGIPAFLFKGGRVRMENCSFRDNNYADVGFEYIQEDGDEESIYFLEISNSNFLGGSDSTAVKSEIDCKGSGTDCIEKPLLKNNWYGHLQGPTQESDSIDKGKKISGDYTLDGYRNSDLISDPVIVIPGIMGSAEIAGKLVMDPILHTYDNLLNSLDQNGYQENINLFEFPYEWRNSNVLTADLLKQKVRKVKVDTGVSKVDLVAHSMGGLVARYYIEGDDYQDDVDQLITLGTPHKGSPESFMFWEAGEGFFSRRDQIAKKLFQIEAHHAGYGDLKDYIQNKVKSVGELLPDYDYLQKVSNGEMKNYPDGYPKNSLLDFLNKDERIGKLDEVDFTNIIGDLDTEKTIKKFRIVESTVSGKWEHGMPENFYDDATDRGIEYGKGDRTVPKSSSTGIDSNELIEINATHTQLPSRAQCKVLAKLSNKLEKNCLYIRDTAEIKSILTFGIFSPVDIQVVDPDGKKVGKNFETGEIINQIEGAYYSGSGTENEFLTIPNPKDGEYDIFAEGTGNGEYEIKVTKILEDDEMETTESIQKITGIATVGVVEERTLTIGGEDEVLDEIEEEDDDDETPVVVADSDDDSDDEDNDPKKDKKKDETDLILAVETYSENNFSESDNIFENIKENLNENILGINYDPQNLPKHNEENKKYTGVVIIAFLVAVIFGIIFFMFRRRVDKKV